MQREAEEAGEGEVSMPKPILAIDPGQTESGVVALMPDGKTVSAKGVLHNRDVLRLVQTHSALGWCRIAIEMVASYGMPVGKEVFETVRWIGRFQQAAEDPEAVEFVYRLDVKLHLCQNSRAKDANIRQALIDKLGPQGTKKNPGPTYGVKSHAWAALAVAVTAFEKTAR